MTRTHVDEGELVELQRKALALFTRVSAIADLVHSPYLISEVAYAQSLAREVSDQVDALTDFVRHSRMIDEVAK